MTPESVAPYRMTHDRVTHDRMTPEKVTPDMLTPDIVTPERVSYLASRVVCFVQTSEYSEQVCSYSADSPVQ